MAAGNGLWRAVRWPVLVLAVAVAAMAAATVLDRTVHREWALTIGAPALWVLLPLGTVWLVVAVLLYAVRPRGRGR